MSARTGVNPTETKRDVNHQDFSVYRFGGETPMKTKDIENIPTTIQGLCKLAGKLGYTDGNYGSGPTLSDGSDVGHLLSFLYDNQGAIEAVLEWAAENHGKDEDEDTVECPDCSADMILDEDGNGACGECGALVGSDDLEDDQ